MKKKKVLVTLLSASLVCAAAAITFAACGGSNTLYDVTYDKGGEEVTGTLPEGGKYKADESFTLPGSGDLAYEGYGFDGWSYNGSIYQEGEEFYMPASNVKFTAQWAELVTVSYEWDGGTKPEGAAESTELPEAEQVKVGTAFTLPTLEAKQYYSFSGWKVKTTGILATSPYTISQDITFCAVFTRTGYHMVNYSFGETAADNHAASTAKLPEAKEAAEGTTVTLASAPAAASGWTFTTWEVRRADNNALVGNYEAGQTFEMPTASVNVTAHWEQVFTITYSWGTDNGDKPDGAAKEAELPANVTNIKGGTVVSLPTLAAAENYVFNGWKVDDTTEIVKGDYTVTKSVTLTAVFTIEGYYTVTYSLGAHAAQGAQTPTQADQEAGATVTLAAAPAGADGWEFVKWEVKDEDGSDVEVTSNQFTMPHSNVTITAIWARGSYTIVFLSDVDQSEGTSVSYTKDNKLSEGAEYPTELATDSNGWTVVWAVKGDADTKLDGDSEIRDLLDLFTEDNNYTLTVYATYHLEIGTPDNANAYPGFNAAWNTTIQKGEKIELKGTMTSKAANNWESVWAYIWSSEISGYFRMDNWVQDTPNAGEGAAMCTAENWTKITKSIVVNWDDFQGIIANCEITISLNWVSDTLMILTMKGVSGEKSFEQTYTITAESFAESYKFGLNGELSYGEFTEFKKHTHSYGSDDFCEEEGCNQVNPVHTAHKWVNGICTTCGISCDHAGASATQCDTCGATIATTAADPSSYDTEPFNTYILTQTLNKGEVLVVTGTQTRANADDNAHSIVCEIQGEVTIRMDQYGSTFGEAFEGNDWGNGGVGASPKNSVDGAVTKDGATAPGDYWVNVNGLKQNCTWSITIDYRHTDKVLFTFVLVGADGSDYAGITYTVNYSIAFKETATPADSYTVGFGAENAAGTFTNCTTYSWAN